MTRVDGQPPARIVYLLRHAKSSWDDPSLADRDRPLAPRGRQAVERLARHVREREIAPARVLCSPAARTRQTLAGLRRALGDPPTAFVPALYSADDRELLEALRGAPDDAASVLLVAHNPGLHGLATALVGAGDPELRARLRAKLPTGGLVTIAFDEACWRDVAPGRGELVAFVVPRELARRPVEDGTPGPTP